VKKFLFLFLFGFSLNLQAQSKRIGTLYREHPYISAINRLTNLVEKGDTLGMRSFYSDSVKFYDAPAYSTKAKP